MTAENDYYFLNVNACDISITNNEKSLSFCGNLAQILDQIGIDDVFEHFGKNRLLARIAEDIEFEADCVAYDFDENEAENHRAKLISAIKLLSEPMCPTYETHLKRLLE